MYLTAYTLHIYEQEKLFILKLSSSKFNKNFIRFFMKSTRQLERINWPNWREQKKTNCHSISIDFMNCRRRYMCNVYKKMGGIVMRMCFFCLQNIKNEIEHFFLFNFGIIFSLTFIMLYTILRNVENLWPNKICLPENLFSFRIKNRFEAKGARCSLFTQYQF